MIDVRRPGAARGRGRARERREPPRPPPQPCGGARLPGPPPPPPPSPHPSTRSPLPPRPQKFDPDNTKTLSLDEYIRACLFLQTAARTFAAFDPSHTGSITTNFSQFIYCCSHVR
jgi:hypothetical protein